nr:MAG TPA: hypothetical protein [Caudoviricetes sp.]
MNNGRNCIFFYYFRHVRNFRNAKMRDIYRISKK